MRMDPCVTLARMQDPHEVPFSRWLLGFFVVVILPGLLLLVLQRA